LFHLRSAAFFIQRSALDVERSAFSGSVRIQNAFSSRLRSAAFFIQRSALDVERPAFSASDFFILFLVTSYFTQTARTCLSR
jgi:hypothetical protein